MASSTPFWRFVLSESIAIALLAAAAMNFPRLIADVLRKFEIVLHRLARRRVLAFSIVFASVLLLRLAYWPASRIPQPTVHDEFSYLLAADTFASGRLTNPPHPMWQHFESFHILQQPTYQSMYPPAQGLVLAFGQVFFGNPWFGVWFATAAMCAIFYWMFAAWVPVRWAFLGALVVAVRIGLFSYWMNSYWGGSITAIGGALVLGAWPRIRRRHRTRDALLLGLGLAILANSRPFEGLLVSIPVAVAFLAWLIRNPFSSSTIRLRKVFLPIAAVLFLTAAAMGIYFHAVTGSAFRMPFSVNRATYAVAPIFLWKKPNPIPEYRHLAMRVFYLRFEYFNYLIARDLTGWEDLVRNKARDIWAFYLGVGMLVPFLTVPKLLRDRRIALLWFCVTLVFIGSSFVWFSAPHYFAPAACALYALALRGLQYIRSWRRRDAGLVLAMGIPLVCILSFPLLPAVRQLSGDVSIQSPADWWTVNRSFPQRAKIAREILSQSPKNLVIVRYPRLHNPDQEWVYNAANIDAAPIVWARDLGSQKNLELIEYFKGRRVWLLEPDFEAPRLEPYPM